MKNLKYLLFIIGISLFVFLPYDVEADTPDQVTITSDGWVTRACNYSLEQIETTAGQAYCLQGDEEPPRAGCKYQKTGYYTEDPGLVSLLNINTDTINKYNAAQVAVYAYINSHDASQLFNGYTGARGYPPKGGSYSPSYAASSSGAGCSNSLTWYNNALNQTGGSATAESENFDFDIDNPPTEGTEKCQDGIVITRTINLTGENVDWKTLTVSSPDVSDISIYNNAHLSCKGSDCSVQLVVNSEEVANLSKLSVTFEVDSIPLAGRYYVYELVPGSCDLLGFPTFQSIMLKSPGVKHKSISYTIDPFVPCTDFSLDVTCGTCDETGDKPSFIIQDTTDWQSIFNSNHVNKNSNAYGYYDQNDPETGDSEGCHVYCREEYRVYFPNEDDEVYVEAGRYFTFNLEGDIMIGTVPNYKLVKVQKVKECRATQENGEEEVDSPYCMEKYDASQEAPKAGENTGKVTIQYKETLEDGVYNANNPIELQENEERRTYNDDLNGSSATYEITNWYELPTDTYRYVDIQTGVSQFKKPTSNLDEHYRDLKVENFPISYDNYATEENGGVGANVWFQYELPDDSLISDAFVDENNWFYLEEYMNANLYTKYVDNGYSDNGDEDLREQLENSACAEMYGYDSNGGNQAFNACADDRVTNKGDHCIEYINKGFTDDYYKCDVLVCPQGEFICSNGECSEDKKCNCEIVGDKYYYNNVEVSFEEYVAACGTPPDKPHNKCLEKNGNYYYDGKQITYEEYVNVYGCDGPPDDGNNDNNKCMIDDDGRYFYNGVEVDEETYMAYCSGGPNGPSECTDCEGNICCPGIGMICPDEDGNCPIPDGINIIYRTIDLFQPFPGQDAGTRDTGWNWCSYNAKYRITTCESTNITNPLNPTNPTNPVVYDHILHNRGNDNEDVYDITPLYEYTLSASEINNIRDYNRKRNNDYSVWNMEYAGESNGDKVFYSSFLRDGQHVQNFGGQCSDPGLQNLLDCAETNN